MMNIKIKKISIGFAALVLMGAAVSCKRTSGKAAEPEYECIAYVWQEEGKLPPANMVTAINYLAAIPNRTHDGVQINNIPRLQRILNLKKENPALKVILSMGGAGAESGWAEMTGRDSLRLAFAADCKRIVDKYELDGVDFDWEFPANEEEQANYIRLFSDVRNALGRDKVVSAAAGFFGNGFDMREAMKYLDYVNLMTYDMGWQAPYHHTALRRSELAGVSTIEESIDSFLTKGLDYKDMVLGLAFYGRGNDKDFKGWTDYRDIVNRNLAAEGMEERWDSIACVPYIVDSLGTLIVGYENPKSLKIKCDYIKEKGLRGGMYWRSELDDDSMSLTRTVVGELLGR